MPLPAWPSQQTYLHGMQLVNHGGKCCGIKSIYNMLDNPDDTHLPLPAIPFNDSDSLGFSVSSNMRFFHEEAPKESGKDRLARYIEYMKKWRPRNMLEVVIAEGKYTTQYQNWKDILVEFGFKEVNFHSNSNSGNVCHVFYLNIGDYVPIGSDPVCPEDDLDEDEIEAPW